MTDEQIKRLLAQAKRRFHLRNLALPVAGGAVTGAAVAMALARGSGGLAVLFVAFSLLPGWHVSHEAWLRAREFRRAPALGSWNALLVQGRLVPDASDSTLDLGWALSEVYRLDARGEFLPLVQAARLLQTYDSQQKRLDAIAQRTFNLYFSRRQLTDKAARLAALGDQNPAALSSLDAMNAELAALERLREETQASCERLETIVLSVHQAAQARQLNREIAELTAGVSPSGGAALSATSDLYSVERQIGREIETFLRLERETDEHLRAI